MYAIETFSLCKKFIEKDNQSRLCAAVKDVNLRIKQQEIAVLIGENGAGKTTLIKLLSCLIYPTSGSALVAGYDILKQEYNVRGLVGLVLGDERNFYWRLTGRENLEFFAFLCICRSSRDYRVCRLGRRGLRGHHSDRSAGAFRRKRP